MSAYRVTRTIQARHNEPVEMVWAQAATPVQALHALAAILRDEESERDHMPEQVRYRTLRIVFDVVEDEEVSEADGDAADAHVSGGSA